MKKIFGGIGSKITVWGLSTVLAAGSVLGGISPFEVSAEELYCYETLDRTDWNVEVHSFYSTTPASHMLDGQADTIWETNWENSTSVDFSNGAVEAITIDLGEVTENVSQLLYLPRAVTEGYMVNGIVTGWEVLAGTTLDSLQSVASGTWEATGTEKRANFDPVKARYIKLKVSAASQNPSDTVQTITCAELNVAVRTEINLEENFYTLPQSELTNAYVTTEYFDNPFTYMLDGNPSSFWETDWSSGAVLFQSGDYFIVDLGKSTEYVARILYTPRQDSSNGRIKEYEIYTSNAQSLNGYDLSANGFQLAGKGSWEPDATTKTATFLPRTAKYVAVKVNSVGGDGNTITGGELNIALKKNITIDTTAAETKITEIETIIANTENPVIKEKLQGELDKLSGSVSEYTQEGISYLLEQLQEAVDTYASIGTVDCIRTGKAWVDTEGERIQAHGSNILFDEKTKTYYWYGEHKGTDNISTGMETGTPAIGISCYSSKDLYNWVNEGVALPVFNNPQIVDGTGTDDTPLYLSEDSEAYQNSSLLEYSGTALVDEFLKSPVNSLSMYNTDEYIAALNALYTGVTLEEKQEIYAEFNWNRVVERPKVVYNKNTDKYVMWWHQDGPTVGQYTVASAGVAISDSPTGPFKYLDTFRLPNVGNTYGNGGEGMLRDMTLFADDDGTGYVIFSSEDNATTIIQKLNKEYTKPSGSVEGTDYVRAFIGAYREAPAVFKDGDNYYMITSGQSGWNPNPCKYSVSKNGIMGVWSEPQFFCIDDITLNNEPAATQDAGTTYRSQSTHVLPVRDAEGNIVPGKFIYMGDRWFREDLKDSRYIWLPIDLDSEKAVLTMEWRDCWKIEDLIPDSEVSDTQQPEHIHTWGAEKIQSEATVFQKKVVVQQCTECGTVETKEIGELLSPSISTNATGDKIVMKRRQTTTGLSITGLASGDSIVSIESSNKKALEVSKIDLKKGTCKLKAKKGKAVLTITLKSGLKKNIQVTVQSGKVKTKSIKNIEKRFVLKEGKQFTLKPILEPFTSQDKIKYSTANKKVVSVTSKGILKAVKKGKTTITVKAGKKVATMKITVN